MMKLIFIVICIFGATKSNEYLASSLSNNRLLEVILDRIELVYETPDIAEWHIRVRKVNKTRAIVGFVIVREQLSNEHLGEFKVLRKQGGEYRYLPYTIPRVPFCDAIKQDKYVYPDLAKVSNLSEDIKDSCPLAPGNYSTDGYIFNTDNIPLSAAQSGEYAIEALFYKKNGQHTGTYRVYAYVNKV